MPATRRRVRKEPLFRICRRDGCSVRFRPRRADARYCSDACRAYQWNTEHPRQREGNVRAFDVMEARARGTDPETSHAAARTVKNITETHRAILEAYRLWGSMTDEELVHNYPRVVDCPKASESGIRSRRAELVRLGSVRDSGHTIRLKSGRHGVLWALVKEGV